MNNMRNRIDEKFKILKDENKKALITYVTAGDPDINTTGKLVLQMEKSGADIIEIGIPYSDPIADGPVIQRAAERALSKGLKIKDIFEMIKETRKNTDIPILFLVYYNCVFQYGIDKFLEHCIETGVDGLIIPDIPYEESEDIRREGESRGVHIITLVAPTSSGRIKTITTSARGFIYCVSSTGVTGMRNTFDADLMKFVEEIGKYTTTPRAIGFGISSAEHVTRLKNYCDGVIVGSAIVKIIEDYAQSPELERKVGQFIAELKSGLE